MAAEGYVVIDDTDGRVPLTRVDIIQLNEVIPSEHAVGRTTIIEEISRRLELEEMKGDGGVYSTSESTSTIFGSVICDFENMLRESIIALRYTTKPKTPLVHEQQVRRYTKPMSVDDIKILTGLSSKYCSTNINWHYDGDVVYGGLYCSPFYDPRFHAHDMRGNKMASIKFNMEIEYIHNLKEDDVFYAPISVCSLVENLLVLCDMKIVSPISAWCAFKKYIDIGMLPQNDLFFNIDQLKDDGLFINCEKAARKLATIENAQPAYFRSYAEYDKEKEKLVSSGLNEVMNMYMLAGEESARLMYYSKVHYFQTMLKNADIYFSAKELFVDLALLTCFLSNTEIILFMMPILAENALMFNYE